MIGARLALCSVLALAPSAAMAQSNCLVSATCLQVAGPNGAPLATAANQPALNADGGVPAHVNNFPAVQPTQDAGTLPSGVTQPTGGVGLTGLLGGIYAKLLGSLSVTGTFWQTTQPVSLASVPLPAGAATAANQITQSTPTESVTTIGTTSTNFGTAGSYHALFVQVQGQPMCVTFGAGTPTAPSAAGVCAVGAYYAIGASFSYTVGVPSSQGKAAALAAGGSIWESVP